MKNKIFLFGLLLVLCDVFGEYDYVRNSDEKENIERPCAVYDIRCIRKFFAEHGKCSIATGPAPEPYIRSQANIEISLANISVTVFDQQIQGLNGRIEEFYVNKDKGNIVIAIDLSPLVLTANNTFFIFQRRAKEPVVTVGLAQVSYQSLILTAVIPDIDNLKLDQAEVTAFSNTLTPELIIGPGVYSSSDPTVQLALAELVARLPVSAQEMLLVEAPVYASLYIQYNICDFGLKVV